MAIKIVHPCYDQNVILQLRSALSVIILDADTSPRNRSLARAALSAYAEDQVKSATVASLKIENN